MTFRCEAFDRRFPDSDQFLDETIEAPDWRKAARDFHARHGYLPSTVHADDPPVQDWPDRICPECGYVLGAFERDVACPCGAMTGGNPPA